MEQTTRRGQWCEECEENRWSAIRRPDFGRKLCGEHYRDALRKNPPTGLVRRPGYYLEQQCKSR